MNVICPKCKENYSIKIELYLNKEQQLKCISCGHKWKENFSKEAIKELYAGSGKENPSKSGNQSIPFAFFIVYSALRPIRFHTIQSFLRSIST